MNLLLAVLIAYLLGSIPFTQVVARTVKGVDLRTVGSRNVGGRNLSRQLGVAWGLLGGGLDVVKGAAAMLVAVTLLPPGPALIWPVVAAVAGHNWPLWLGLRGGKGLSAALGVMLVVAPLSSVVAFIVAVIVLRFTGNILLTGLSGFITLFLMMWQLLYPDYLLLTLGAAFITVLLAALPDVVHKLRTAGGVAEYMRNPNKVYEEEAQKWG